MIRTKKIPAMILTGTFPAPRDGGGEGTIGGIIGSCSNENENIRWFWRNIQKN
jgi:hypothetical protein